jgi:hypothetical protein
MRAFLLRRFDKFSRRRADAGVDHVEPRVAGAHGDLLGAIRMAIEAGLADQKFRPLAELLRHALDFAAHGVERAADLSGRRGDAGRGAILPEHPA